MSNSENNMVTDNYYSNPVTDSGNTYKLIIINGMKECKKHTQKE